MARYLDPKNDLTFKRIFAEHPNLLIHFLNAVMPFAPDRYIVDIEYLPSEQVPDNPGKKNSIVDVRCKDNYKRQFIIEMQMDWEDVFMNRIVFNAGKAYVKQLVKRDGYHLLHPVYTLAILNDTFDFKSKRFYHHYQIVNRENTDEIIPGLEFVLIELEKLPPATTDEAKIEDVSVFYQANNSSYPDVSKNLTDNKLTMLWLRFLKEVDEGLKALPAEFQENEYIRQAAELCEESAFSPEELAAYERNWDIIRTEIAVRESIRLKSEAIGLKKGETIGLKKGEAIGLEKGEAIGLEKGETIGLKKGEAKLIEQQENVVINSHRAGLSIETISTITGLTHEQIIKILGKHG